LFGLTNGEGNHGEDVKELYYYLDATPSHSYLKMLYKYPQQAFPYTALIEENRKRGRDKPEFELLDTGLFNNDRYFDVFIEYAKAGVDDILMLIMAHNRSADAAPLHILPQIWFRNTWNWGYDATRPSLSATETGEIMIQHASLGSIIAISTVIPTCCSLITIPIYSICTTGKRPVISRMPFMNTSFTAITTLSIRKEPAPRRLGISAFLFRLATRWKCDCA
jgi:hypothetical protein